RTVTGVQTCALPIYIEYNRNPIRRFKLHLTTKTDPTVTNPARLKAADSALDCGQCHSVWAFNNMSDKIDFNRHGSGYRPGAHDQIGRASCRERVENR